jgi:hypothetical protein
MLFFAERIKDKMHSVFNLPITTPPFIQNPAQRGVLSYLRRMQNFTEGNRVNPIF